MKLLKKLTAVVMAAVMSAAMLTACSGGGSSVTLVTPKDCKEYTLITKDVKNDEGPLNSLNSAEEYYTTNGEWSYTQYSARKATLYNSKERKVYRIDLKSKTYTENKLGSSGDQGTAIIPSYEITTGTEEYEGKTYKTKTYKMVESGIECDDVYFFDGTKLVYYKYLETNGTDSTWIISEVKEFRTTADTSKFSLEGYTKVGK